MEEAPRKFFRLKPGGEVRLRFGYIIRCDEVIKNDAGEVVELRCSYDPGHAQWHRQVGPQSQRHHSLGVMPARSRPHRSACTIACSMTRIRIWRMIFIAYSTRVLWKL